MLHALLYWLCLSRGKRSQKAICIIDRNVQVNEDGQGEVTALLTPHSLHLHRSRAESPWLDTLVPKER